jgi:hypothetical protein
MAKNVTCKKCGQEGLFWRQSKKGNWYLCEPDYVSTNSAYKNKLIPFAHKCKEQYFEERNESYYFDHADGSFV